MRNPQLCHCVQFVYVVNAYITNVSPPLKLAPMPRQRRAWNECVCDGVRLNK